MPAANFSSISQLSGNPDCGIKDVWNHNLHEEFQIIRQVCLANTSQLYIYVSCDCKINPIL